MMVYQDFGHGAGRDGLPQFRPSEMIEVQTNDSTRLG